MPRPQGVPMRKRHPLNFRLVSAEILVRGDSRKPSPAYHKELFASIYKDAARL
jgi:hypothetical protein